MIPSYYVAMHQLHSHEVNNVSIRSHPAAASVRNMYTEKELRQPLRQVPDPRSGHVLLSCPQRRSIILHGGLNIGPNGAMNDTWEFSVDLQRWVQLICRGAPANGTNSVRENASVGGSRSGGANAVNSHNQYYGNADVPADDGEMPPKAFGQCGALFGDGRFLMIHGGIAASCITPSSVYQLDIEKRLWTKLNLTQPIPPIWGSVAQVVRLPASVAADTGGREITCTEATGEERFVEVVVIFGGVDQEKAYNDTYYLYLTEPPPSSGCKEYAQGEMRVVKKLESLPTDIFPGRRRACSVVCNNFFLFVFGGREENTFYNDLWVLNSITQRWIMVRAETPQRYMQEFFRFPYSREPGDRIMALVRKLLEVRRVEQTSVGVTESPHRCMRYNGSAYWRTGAVMSSYGTNVFILGGFTMDKIGSMITHDDVHVYDYVHHIWREAHVEEGRCLPAFPPNYFSPAQEGVAPQWGLVQNVRSTRVVGRTMAAICPDPVQPSLRFFLFGGRVEDDPCGELYDVRIHLELPKAPSPADPVLERQRELAAVCFPPTWERAPWEISAYCRRSLHQQMVDWIRPLLKEDESLSTVRRVVWQPFLTSHLVSVPKSWRREACELGVSIREKVGKLSIAMQRFLEECPLFVLREH
uniref:Uncharacterized protein n=1 Tax=Trypanosoma congolense (strain IL3000) TaxID=1068625 RepID=G0UMS2_TRYCI|nr:conserved hypothetical protein [Trypanosoma congolense IL3000]